MGSFGIWGAGSWRGSLNLREAGASMRLETKGIGAGDSEVKETWLVCLHAQGLSGEPGSG